MIPIALGRDCQCDNLTTRLVLLGSIRLHHGQYLFIGQTARGLLLLQPDLCNQGLFLLWCGVGQELIGWCRTSVFGKVGTGRLHQSVLLETSRRIGSVLVDRP